MPTLWNQPYTRSDLQHHVMDLRQLADIRDFSDYFIEGDLFEVLPKLTEAIERGEPVPMAADGRGDE